MTTTTPPRLRPSTSSHRHASVIAGPASAATLVFGALAIFVGVLAARQPLAPGNAAVHYGYPFFSTVIALLFLGTVQLVRDSRMALPVSLLALGYAVNGLLIALVSYGGTRAGSFIPLKGVGLLEDVFFLLPDIGLTGFLVPLLPYARPAGARRRVLLALASLTGLVALGQLVVPHVIDSTVEHNPLGIPALSPLTNAVGAGIGLLFIVAALVSLCSGIVTSRRGYGAAPALAGVSVIVGFVAQAAVPESSWWAAGAVMVAGCSSILLFVVRTVRRAAALDAR